MGLTTEQSRAALTTSRRTFVRAGAGTGKTRTLIERVGYLLDHHVDPQRILVLTFTHYAADELNSRLNAPPELFMGTIHAWSARVAAAAPEVMWRAPGFGIYDETDYSEVARMAAFDAGVDDPWNRKAGTLLRDSTTSMLHRDRMRAANALGFSDLLDHAMAVLNTIPATHAAVSPFRSYQHVLVDEAQDLTPRQWDLIDMVADEAHLWVVGDPRQAIYRWRGAVPSELATRRWAEVVDLTHNFRSTGGIVAVANAVEPKYPDLVATVRESSADVLCLVGDHPDHELSLTARHIDQFIGEGHAPGDIAILGRTWAQLGRLHQKLISEDIPAQMHGPVVDAWTSTVGRGAALYLRALARPYDDEMLAMALRSLCPGTESAIADLRKEASRKRLSLLEAAREIGLLPTPQGEESSIDHLDALVAYLGVGSEVYRLVSDMREMLERPDLCTPARFARWWLFARSAQDHLTNAADAVQLLTIHAAKGLEWPLVVVPGCLDDIHPGHTRTPTAEHEARSVFYVAVTRPSTKLVLTWSTSSCNEEPLPLSPYLPRTLLDDLST